MLGARAIEERAEIEGHGAPKIKFEDLRVLGAQAIEERMEIEGRGAPKKNMEI